MQALGDRIDISGIRDAGLMFRSGKRRTDEPKMLIHWTETELSSEAAGPCETFGHFETQPVGEAWIFLLEACISAQSLLIPSYLCKHGYLYSNAYFFVLAVLLGHFLRASQLSLHCLFWIRKLTQLQYTANTVVRDITPVDYCITLPRV